MSRQFTWWRRFYSTQKLQPKHMFKGASKLLQRIEAGEFEHDGLWEQSYLEEEIADQKFDEFKKKNQGISQDVLDNVYVDFRKNKNKRMGIMRENHLKNEINLLHNLKVELAKEFDLEERVVWDFMQEFEGDTRHMYFAVKDIANGKQPRGKEDVERLPVMIQPQPRHLIKRANAKYLPLWKKIISKYNFYRAYPYE
jgi:hypothetical protein